MRDARQRLWAGALALGASAWSGAASAYCRTTTCDPLVDEEGCRPVMGCATRGEALFWPDACVTFAVQRQGSALRGVSGYELDRVMREAFSAWLGSDCPQGGKPSLGVIPLGGATCDKAEFNPPEQGRAGAPNANLVMFRDQGWPYPDERFVIARTSITFDVNSGAIYDADIEINSFQNDFSTAEGLVSNDLQAVLTHEVGHFIGLDHSLSEYSTMQANYDLSNLGTRTLSSDDTAGVCSIYSPLEDAAPGCPGDTGPVHGYSRECGSDAQPDASCGSMTGASPRSARGALAVGALGALLVWARSRRRCPR